MRAAALCSLLLGCSAIALGEPRALHAAPPPDDSEGAPARDSVTIRGARLGFNRETRYAHSLPELDGATITVTKKTSVVRLDEQPTTIDNNQRELFDRLPGIVLAEQQNPTQLNLAYRGLGNPQESEYVLLMQDGIPLELDWIGFPTLYYLPVPQTVHEIQMIRAGSGLLYGPEPQPVINFVSRSPAPGRAAAGTSEQVGGTQALFSSFNSVSGTMRDFDYLADFSRRQSDGQRVNGDYALNAGDLHVGYRPDPRQKVSLDVHAYSLGSGLAGLMSAAQYQANRDQTTTPDDRLWTDRYTAVLAYENRFRERDLYSQKIWTGYQDLVTRTDAYTPGGTAASATLGGQRFHYTGLDGRWLHGFGRANALTLGYTVYYSVSPFHELASGNPLIGRDDTSGTALYVDERRSRYGALFAESLFRLRRFHLVISGRFDHEELSTRETLAPHPQLADRTYRKSVPLFGVGVGNDFGRGNETYLNVSQGFRPLRYLDIASPFSNFAAANNPDPTRYLTYEAGVHGWPRPGLYYDVSLFQVNVRNRIESQQFTPTETIDVNTGNTRSRGAELEGSYDVLRSRPQISSARHLSVFANASLLDARFTASSVPGRAGSTPAYAPGYVLKAGVTWRHDGRCRISLVVDSVASQYFQDSDLGVGGTPARIPAYTVIDLAGDYLVLKHLRVLGGISNLADRHYYSRVFLFGGRLEPGRERAFYGGLAYDF